MTLTTKVILVVLLLILIWLVDIDSDDPPDGYA
jgi:hypothetical protein